MGDESGADMDPRFLSEPLKVKRDGDGSFISQEAIPVAAQPKRGVIPTPKQILKPRKPRSDKGKPHHLSGPAKARDNGLSEEQWLQVYDTFQHTGVPKQIAELTGQDVRDVQHLLDHGVRRLGLPPISEHAVDLAQVNTRLKAAGVTGGLPASRGPDENYAMNLPEVQDAVSERTAKEAAAAQVNLNAAFHAGTLFHELLEQVVSIVKADPSRIDVPDTITLKWMKTMAEAANSLSAAMERATKLSRLTAGEPESNLNVLVAHLVCNLPNEALRSFGQTGVLPPELRGRIHNPMQIVEAHAESQAVGANTGDLEEPSGE